MGLLYRVFSVLFIGLLAPFLWLHPKLRKGWRARLGLRADGLWPPARGEGPRIWLHGASAGDLNALAPTIKLLRARLPGATLVVSTMTSSGRVAAERLGPEVDGVTWVPWDLPGATRRTVRSIRPDLLVLEYAEIWPNLVAEAHRFGAKIALTNGRFSEALVGRYRLFYRIFGNPLAFVDLLLMREEVEAERARALGAPKERVRVTGNTKFDSLSRPPSPDVLRALSERIAGPLFVAGSTHEGEERAIVRAFLAMRRVRPELRMILAPRYTERGPKVLSIVTGEGLSGALRSGPPATGVDVLVLDTIGELLAAYSLATLVFVGGSFVTRGGQNILEPAGLGRPVLFGPYMMNFRDSVEVLLGRGGIQVHTPEQLEKIACELLGKPEELERLGAMAHAAVAKVSGASRRNADALLGLLGVA